MSIIREPHVAGMFYPSEASELKTQINSFLKEINLDLTIDHVSGLVSPHAGYVYSGKTAAYAYKALENQNYKTVVVISPSHREYFPGISIYSGDAYKTPLGKIKIDDNLRKVLNNKSDVVFEGLEGHRGEHALEVQLPFLQVMLTDFQLIPIVIGDQRKEFIYELADVLTAVLDDDILIVASSDLSHFYSKEYAMQLDNRVVRHINEYRYEELQSDLETKRCEACGGGGIVALLKAMKNKDIKHSQVVAHTDSGDITGDHTEVVGYLSAVVYN